jgi:hypothetical protein
MIVPYEVQPILELSTDLSDLQPSLERLVGGELPAFIVRAAGDTYEHANEVVADGFGKLGLSPENAGIGDSSPQLYRLGGGTA